MSVTKRQFTVTARWIFPVDQPPLKGGVISVDGDTIAAISGAGTERVDIDFGDAAIVPGFVNAHTHLDLTGMRDLAPPSHDFIGWLRQVIEFRRSRSVELIPGDIRTGIAESLQAGTTLLGDISSDGGSWSELAASPLRAVVFRELIGLPKDRAERAWQSAQTWLGTCAGAANCRPGLSPHAPYSARVSLIRAAALTSLPVAIHLAETEAERDLLVHHAGPFVSFLQDLGVWDPLGLAKGPEHVLRLTAAGAPTLLVHCNFLATSAGVSENATVVFCPRTHAAFGHAMHPFLDFLSRGTRVAIGTDGLSSNPDLSVLAELRFVHRRHPSIDGATLLRLGTLSGAEALGWADQCGSLSVGKSADFVVLPLDERPTDDPHQSWLRSESEPAEVWIRGEQAFPPP